MATTKLYTIEDIEAIDDDVNLYELIEGELHRMPPTSENHMYYGGDLFAELGHYVRLHKLGRMALPDGGFVITRNPDTVLAPDGAFIRADRVPNPLRATGFSEVLPDLVIEITSPSDRRPAIERKIAIWLGAGVSVVWQVDPVRQTVTVYQAEREPIVVPPDGILDGGDIVPGFRLKLSEIFV
jgi:Uma2 family endonuclease